MKARRIFIIILFLATAGKMAIDFAGFSQLYILPTMSETVKPFGPIKMKQLPVTGSSYGYSIAESPDGVESKSVLFGNVTLCCVQNPSVYLPVLFILTSDQMASWKDQSRGPTEWIAETTSTPPLNYTFSGSEGKEVLTFSITATSSSVYHFVVFAPVQEKLILHLSVRTWKLTESWIVSVVWVILGMIGLVFLIYKEWRS